MQAIAILQRCLLWGNPYSNLQIKPMVRAPIWLKDSPSSSPAVISMSYENLRSAFDELACEIFSNCYTMQASDRIASVQKLYDLGLQTLEAAESRDDAGKIRVAISSILHRGYSISSAVGAHCFGTESNEYSPKRRHPSDHN